MTTRVSTPEVRTPRLGFGGRFTALLTTTGLANLGDGMVSVGAPLVALSLTRSPVQIGLLTAATWLPWLLLGLVGGAVVDRRDRRVVQMLALTARSGLLAVGCILLSADLMTMTALVGLVLAYGITEVFADLAQGALVPALVPADRLAKANGRLIAVQQVSNAFVGGPVAGLLLTFGAAWVFGVPAAMAIAGVLVLLRWVPGRYATAPTPTGSPAVAEPSPTRAAADVREGLSYLVHHAVLRPLVVSSAVMNMANAAYFGLFVLWVVGPGSRLQVDAAQYPLITAVLAVGAVLGSLVTGALVAALPELLVMLGSWALGAMLMLVPIVVPTVPALVVVLFLLGAFSTIGNTVSITLRQRIVPSRLLGRVSGAGRSLSYGLMPLGAVLAGIAADRWGLVPVFVGAAAIASGAIVYPALCLRGRMVAEAEARRDA
jgi:MFS family permease